MRISQRLQSYKARWPSVRSVHVLEGEEHWEHGPKSRNAALRWKQPHRMRGWRHFRNVDGNCHRFFLNSPIRRLKMASLTMRSMWPPSAMFEIGYVFGDTKPLFLVQVVQSLQSFTKATTSIEQCRSRSAGVRFYASNCPLILMPGCDVFLQSLPATN